MKDSDRAELINRIEKLEMAENLFKDLKQLLSRRGFMAQNSDYYIPCSDQLDALESVIGSNLDRAYVERSRADR